MVTSQSILRIATISCISLVVFVLFPSSIANVAVAQEYITVTTTVDELYDNEFCSLREAVESANFGIPILGCQVDIAANAKTSLSPDEWVIDVPAGTYVLDIAGAGEDDNVTGDLDFTVTYG